MCVCVSDWVEDLCSCVVGGRGWVRENARARTRACVGVCGCFVPSVCVCGGVPLCFCTALLPMFACVCVCVCVRGRLFA